MKSLPFHFGAAFRIGKAELAVNITLCFHGAMPGDLNVDVKLDGFSKPADTFIKKISKGMGGMFAYGLAKQEGKAVVELARAEALANVERVRGEIAVTELHRRAAQRFVEEQALNQLNMESIAAQAVPLLTNSAEPEKVEDDWVANFWDKSRIVSDAHIQEFFAKVLAGEANQPGAFSKRTVNFLADFEKRDAELFSRLCGYCWEMVGPTPFIFDDAHDIYKRNGMDFSALSHLEAIGLIKHEALTGFVRLGLQKKISLEYQGLQVVLTLPKDSDNNFQTGRVMFTAVGRELAQLVKPVEVPGFVAYCLELWKDYLRVQWEVVEGGLTTSSSSQ